MKAVIIPDIHHKIGHADKIIKHENADLVIFTGDYFDDFNDNVGIAARTANWLKNSLTHENRIHLFGNHDISYAYPNTYTSCSGFTDEKCKIINSILTKADWKRLQFYHIQDDVLFTHAGLSRMFYNSDKDGSVEDYMEDQSRRAMTCLGQGKSHWFYRAGFSRGGRQAYGGITWCDAREEFATIVGQPQVFGHTICEAPTVFEHELPSRYFDRIDGPLSTKKFGGINLDCNLRYYAVLENGEISIKTSFLLTS
jgi:hypothetical protein